MKTRLDHPNRFITLLLRIGFVKWGRKSCVCDLRADGTWSYRFPEQIIWPFHAPPLWQLKKPVFWLRWYWSIGPVYRFKNLKGVIKWVPGRLLPRRWGFGICGFEFGDRG